MPRQTKAIINLKNLESNYELVQSLAPNSKNVAVIKADGYGHGLVEVAHFLEAKVPAFAVAFFEEAVILRESGVKKPIIILQGVHEESEIIFAAENQCWPMVHSFHQVETILNCPLSSKLFCWIKIDVGLHRLGMNERDILKSIELLLDCPWVDDALVISSHFSHAPEISSDNNSIQLKEFNRIYHNIETKFSRHFERSMANSASLVDEKNSQFEWNRPGMILYGLPVFTRQHKIDEYLKPVMTLKSRILAIREIERGESVGYGGTWVASRKSKIATIAIGYADGYPRHASNGTPMFIRNQKASLTGCISMDMLSADVTDIKGVEIGDEVELWGSNISAKTVADKSDTISYELLTGLTPRVDRIYHS